VGVDGLAVGDRRPVHRPLGRPDWIWRALYVSDTRWPPPEAQGSELLDDQRF